LIVTSGKRHVSPRLTYAESRPQPSKSPPGLGPLRTVRRGVTNCTHRRGFLRENTVSGDAVRELREVGARLEREGPGSKARRWRRKPEDEPF
jgi:hypothetical protein